MLNVLPWIHHLCTSWPNLLDNLFCYFIFDPACFKSEEFDFLFSLAHGSKVDINISWWSDQAELWTSTFLFPIFSIQSLVAIALSSLSFVNVVQNLNCMFLASHLVVGIGNCAKSHFVLSNSQSSRWDYWKVCGSVPPWLVGYSLWQLIMKA